MNKTTIDYLTHTWNPIAMRCSKISPACDNCWHLAMANRLAKNPTIGEWEREAYAGGEHVLLSSVLNEPLKRKKTARIGVQFMGDLFHDSVTDHGLTRVFGAMMGARQHTFLLLTKRPGRMLDYFEHFPWGKIPDHLWVGVTAENQEQADKRIPLLMEIPAKVRFVSVEPMLSQIDLTPWLPHYLDFSYTTDPTRLDWVIAGGETGPKARPVHPDWIRSLRDQCVSAEVPFFFKQWGEWLGHNQMCGLSGGVRQEIVDGLSMYRVGKKASGRMLDGRTWEEYPE